ncbi:MAG: amino acid adenylation domain-containing protein [Gammaproteobacteria bacterium]|nr:amino acid adenylation domain-containing protein [Gammaproteobacteria bacterium]
MIYEITEIEAPMSCSFETFPLSSAQTRVWIHQLSEPDQAIYVIGGRLVIEGSLDTELLNAALADVFAGSDALRTRLVPTSELPMQCFPEEPLPTYPFVDLSRATNPEQAVAVAMQGLISTPFDLWSGHLWRFALYRTAPEKHYFAFCFHHLIIDGWGVSLFVQRLAERMRSRANGSTDVSAWPSYRSYLQDDAAYLASSRYKKDRQYWRERLAKPLPSLAAPISNQTTGASIIHSWRFEPPYFEALERTAGTCGGTPFHLFVVALGTYFARTLGVKLFTLGLPALNRTRPEHRQIIGLFAGTRPARIHTRLDQPLSDSVSRIKQALARDYRHYRYSHGLSDHSGNRASRLFDVVLSYEDHDYDVEIPGCRVGMRALLNGYESNGMTIFVRAYHKGRGVRVDFCANPAAFPVNEVDALITATRGLLEGFTRWPDRRLAAQPMVTNTTADYIRKWSEGAKVKEEDDTTSTPLDLMVRIDNWSTAQPRRFALSDGAARFDYQSLLKHVDALASKLQDEGVAFETGVGLYFERRTDFLVATLAVLRAGGMFVPLDPQLPRQRLAWIAGNAKLKLVLTDRTCSQLAHDLGLPVRIVSLGDLPTSNPQTVFPTPVPEQLAYVMYTSGSTGTPKGVMITRAGISNYLDWSCTAYGLAQTDQPTLLHGAIGFDATLTSLLAPLVGGSAVVPIDGHGDPTLLGETLQCEKHFAMVKATPAHLSLLDEMMQEGVTTAEVDVLVVGGEALHFETLEGWRRRSRTSCIVNEYGPTEASVGCVTHWLHRGEQIDGMHGAVPIGQPIANMCVRVLDTCLQISPPEAKGEIYLGGIGLARGYLGRPALTAERFVPDPFSEIPGARLYRTGDLGRWRTDGTLEYLGRRDRQVKLRGHRVELEEVEAALRADPEVREARVQVDEDKWGHSRLVAAVTPRENAPLDPEAVRRRAFAWLPEAMVPSVISVVGEVVLNNNGKLALPSELPRSASGKPLNKQEMARAEKLAAIWSSVLGCGNIGLDKDFFTLGGDSILALRVCNQARAAGIAITPSDMFDAATLSDLASKSRPIDGKDRDHGSADGSVEDELPLTPMLRWLVARQPSCPDRYVHLFEATTHPDTEPQALALAVQALWRRHPAMRVTLAREGGVWRHRIRSLNEPMPDLFQLTDASEFDAAVMVSVQALDLARGRTLVILLSDRDARGQRRVAVIAHHLIVDVVSWPLLLADLGKLLIDPETPLAEGAGRYAYWARAVGAAVTGIGDATQMAGAFEQGTDSSGIAVAPLIGPPVAGGYAEDESFEHEVTFELDATRSEALLSEATEQYHAAVDEITLAAVAKAVWSARPKSSINVDLEHHGRDVLGGALDLSSTLGWLAVVRSACIETPDDLNDPLTVVAATQKAKHRAVSATTDISPELCFNFLGRFDVKSFAAEVDWCTPESIRRLRDSDSAPPYAVEIEACIANSQLIVVLRHDPRRTDSNEVTRLSQGIMTALQWLIDARNMVTAPDSSNREFPAARLDQHALDAFLARFR